MTAFHSNYLQTPQPGSSSSVQINGPAYTCDTTGYTYLALLWSPASLPTNAGNPPSVNLTVTATQAGTVAGSATLKLQPPPVLLVHGVWSNSTEAKFSPGSGGLFDWLNGQYPHALIRPVDYGGLSQFSFTDSTTQHLFEIGLRNLLKQAAADGLAARQVDVVAHSMGGLVTRYFAAHLPSDSRVPQNPLHTLITIGTPHLGSELARQLYDSKTALPDPVSGLIVNELCTFNFVFPCTLENFFSKVEGKPVDTGIESLKPTNPDLYGSSPGKYSAIVGQSPLQRLTEVFVNVVIGGFLPGKSVGSILGTISHDTIVPTTSQQGNDSQRVATIPGIVHTSLSHDGNFGETESQAVWNQTFTWLTGLQPATALVVSKAAAEATTSAPLPIFDLTGYTAVAASNVNLSPPTNSTLTIGTPVNIAATSATKSITQVLLFQTVVDPTDLPLRYATQFPYSIAFASTRLGAADFVAFVMFSDMTYAVTALHYPLQPSGTPIALGLYLGPATGNTLFDAGPLSNWRTTAGCP